MQVINSPREMQELALQWRAEGKKIAFVPTMGALHEGHLSLLREGRLLGDKSVLSIFVNPVQFGPREDIAKYPRPIEDDLAKARDCKTDAVFFPTPETMYPNGFQTYVEVERVTQGLCGEKRPGHFRGVTTVVLKLFNIVLPNIAIFGEKDFQQLVTIKRMSFDLNLPIKIIGMPTVREKDGLAMSSRNVYLSKEERQTALSISQSMATAQEMAISGEKDAAKIIAKISGIMKSAGVTKIDYIKICDSKMLAECSQIGNGTRLLLAAFVGTTRLIDNCEL
ncbi:MAG: pantoate--beta-alanine ligase [Deltaproteobacteria bacterium RIFCSPLOWO2_02_FULL_47_10]|nr:MAG: pantoate--beta-alanine ligase [Deltaproteobacteria bacterium RIFCSPLOWO2_02_FULL_47_10]